MTSPVSSTESKDVTTTTPVTTDTNTQQAGSEAKTTSAANGSTKVNNMGDLKKESPELYEKMLEGIAMTMCNRMKDSQDRIIEINREARRNS